MIRRPPISTRTDTLLPYTTLFRSDRIAIWRGPMLRPWQVSLGARIDPSRDVPIYMQIIQALIRDIARGRLTSGTYLPSSRQLAKVLGVNRKTVVFASEDLIAQGWLDSAGTRGSSEERRGGTECVNTCRSWW